MTMTRRSAVSAAALALLVPVVGVGTAGPAAAHTELTSSSPANGASVAPPANATLVFNEPVKPSAITLRSSKGASQSIGKPQVNGKTVVVPIKSTLAPGGYLLSYAVVSADGHPVKGTVAFRVKG
jgi:methionine-rich copper-binding protein CopC